MNHFLKHLPGVLLNIGSCLILVMLMTKAGQQEWHSRPLSEQPPTPSFEQLTLGEAKILGPSMWTEDGLTIQTWLALLPTGEGLDQLELGVEGLIESKGLNCQSVTTGLILREGKQEVVLLFRCIPAK